MQARVFRQVDLAHAAGAEFPDDSIVKDRFLNGKAYYAVKLLTCWVRHGVRFSAFSA